MFRPAFPILFGLLCGFFLIVIAGSVLAQEPESVTVFDAAQDGYVSIRIPSILVTPKGTVMAVEEGREANTD